jgi:hypothetical protein
MKQIEIYDNAMVSLLWKGDACEIISSSSYSQENSQSGEQGEIHVITVLQMIDISESDCPDYQDNTTSLVPVDYYCVKVSDTTFMETIEPFDPDPTWQAMTDRMMKMISDSVDERSYDFET